MSLLFVSLVKIKAWASFFKRKFRSDKKSINILVWTNKYKTLRINCDHQGRNQNFFEGGVFKFIYMDGQIWGDGLEFSSKKTLAN